MHISQMRVRGRHLFTSNLANDVVFLELNNDKVFSVNSLSSIVGSPFKFLGIIKTTIKADSRL